MHIVLFSFHPGKPNPVYQEIAGALRKRGHEVWIGLRNESGNLELHDGAQVVGTVPGPKLGGNLLRERWELWRFMARARQYFKQLQPDIVQINPTNLVWALTLGSHPGTQYILDIRQINEAVNDRLITKIKERRDVLVMHIMARYVFDHTCFCHQGAAHRILGDQWQQRSSVVPVGIAQPFLQEYPDSMAAPSAAPPAVATATPIGNTVAVAEPTTAEPTTVEPTPESSNAEKRVRFVYIGGLTTLRNLQNLLAAARVLKEQKLTFKLDLIGRDYSNGYYKSLVDQWDLHGVAEVCDPIAYETVPSTLVQYDVGMAYVPDRPTWHYQPTIKVLEYRALGLPIISTDVASHRPVVEHGVNGLLVADEVQSVAAAMKRFITEPAFLKTCRVNAKAMRQGMTWDEIGHQYEIVYENLFKRA